MLHFRILMVRYSLTAFQNGKQALPMELKIQFWTFDNLNILKNRNPYKLDICILDYIQSINTFNVNLGKWQSSIKLH